ncbi:MAG: TIGR02996 domain-containing protein [Fimbriiglobus sp.]
MDDEAAFLKAISLAPNDNLLRLVYADWLEEQGRSEAAYLRIECEQSALDPADSQHQELATKLRETGQQVKPDWLAMVSRVPVEGCGVEFRFRCPKKWEQLQSSAEESVRFCGECFKLVYFCSTVEMAMTYAALDECVAVDPRVERQPGDLVWETGYIVGLPMRLDSPEPKDD